MVILYFKQGIDDMMISEGHKTPLKVVLATHNAGKVAEITSALQPLHWTFAGMNDLGLPAPEETGSTFLDNAALKAETAAMTADAWALADDSGLEVEALGGQPGVNTADFGGWKHLLEVMKHLPEGERKARFVCVLVLCSKDGKMRFFEGSCEGQIALAAHGEGGFGYDPVFIPQGDTRTFASMTKDEKYTHSHRGAALKALLHWAMNQEEI
jgi:XTP/dITP diphosphohydrolase